MKPEQQLQQLQQKKIQKSFNKEEEAQQ